MLIKDKGAIFKELKKPLSIEGVKFPDPKYDEVLLKVKSIGVSHRLSNNRWRFPPPLMPVILGHEVAGEVYAVGSGVKDLRIGDRVVLS